MPGELGATEEVLARSSGSRVSTRSASDGFFLALALRGSYALGSPVARVRSLRCCDLYSARSGSGDFGPTDARRRTWIVSVRPRSGSDDFGSRDARLKFWTLSTSGRLAAWFVVCPPHVHSGLIGAGTPGPARCCPDITCKPGDANCCFKRVLRLIDLITPIARGFGGT